MISRGKSGRHLLAWGRQISKSAPVNALITLRLIVETIKILLERVTYSQNAV